MKTTTNIYQKDVFVRREGLITLAQYVQMGRLESGQLILIGDIATVEGNESPSNTTSFWVGDCTRFHEVSNSDGGFGWNKTGPNMNKYVLEVHCYPYL